MKSNKLKLYDVKTFAYADIDKNFSDNFVIDWLYTGKRKEWSDEEISKLISGYDTLNRFEKDMAELYLKTLFTEKEALILREHLGLTDKSFIMTEQKLPLEMVALKVPETDNHVRTGYAFFKGYQDISTWYPDIYEGLPFSVKGVF